MGNVSPSEIRDFIGTINEQPKGTVGFFVTNQDYSKRAKNTADNSDKKIFLCNNINIIEIIKNTQKNIEKNNNNFIFEDYNFENIKIDKDSNFKLFDIVIGGGSVISKFSCKRYSPY